MQIKDEDDEIRLEDAFEHDAVLVMIGDPDTGRPLLTLSVTHNGDGLIEYDPEDLAAGIRQLNQTLSEAVRGQIPAPDIQVEP